MKKSLSTLVWSIIAALIIVAGFWCRGFNFDERGDTALGCYILSVVSAVVTALVVYNNIE